MRPHELRDHRKTLKMTQSELGSWLEMRAVEPRRSIHDYEAGRREIPGPVARAVELEIENRKLRAKVKTLARVTMGVKATCRSNWRNGASERRGRAGNWTEKSVLRSAGRSSHDVENYKGLMLAAFLKPESVALLLGSSLEEAKRFQDEARGRFGAIKQTVARLKARL